MSRNVRYLTPQKPIVREFVSLFWTVGGIPTYHSQMILPRGCVQLIFNFSDSVQYVPPIGHGAQSLPACFIEGLSTRRFSVHFTGTHAFVGVRLRPHALRSVLGLLPGELVNHLIDLTLVNPLFRSLWHQLAEFRSFDRRVELLERYFSRLVPTVCQRTALLCDQFLSHDLNGFESVDRLARFTGYSSRHLNRKVHELFGICAEQLVTYKKYMHAVNLMHTGNRTLTQISYLSGFYDQAHFIRTFRSFTDLTPGEYDEAKSWLPFHLFE